MADPGTVSVTAIDKTLASNPGSGSKFVFIGHADGTETALKAISSDNILVDAFGDGDLVEYMGPSVRASGTQYGLRVTGSGGTKSSVTKAGTGPDVTLAFVDAQPNGKYVGKIKISRGGTNASGDARFQYALDGYTYSGDYDLPPPTAATVVGTVDLVAAFPTLTTTTVALVTEDAAAVAGAFSSPTTPALIVSQLQAIIDADLSNAEVDLQEGRFLRIRSGSTGSLSTLDIQAGTAWTLLGIDPTATIAEGADSDFEIPGTGLIATFSTGTHVEGTIHSFTTTAPKASTANLLAAIKTLREQDIEFGGIIICQQNWADALDLKNTLATLASEVASWQVGEPYRNPIIYFGATPGLVDQDIRNAFNGVYSSIASVAVGNCWAVGTGIKVGFLERSTLIYQALLMAVRDESRSIGEREGGSSTEVMITGPDGVTKARDEFVATTKMQDRFNVLIRYKGEPFFMTGRTMANGATQPGFLELAWMRPFLHALQVAHDALAAKLEATPVLKPDGRLREADAVELDNAVNARLQSEILNPTPGRQRASYSRFTYDRTNLFITTKAYTGTIVQQPLGIAHSGDLIGELVGQVSAVGV